MNDRSTADVQPRDVRIGQILSDVQDRLERGEPLDEARRLRGREAFEREADCVYAGLAEETGLLLGEQVYAVSGSDRMWLQFVRHVLGLTRATQQQTPYEADDVRQPELGSDP